MKKFKNMKQKGKKNTLKNYALLTFTCLISAFFGNEYYGSLAFVKKTDITNISFGNRGVFAWIINMFTSGTITSKITNTISSITGSVTIANKILVVIGLIISILFYIFVKNTYKVVARRIFLEIRTYEKVLIHRFTFLLRVKKWIKVSKTLFLCDIYYFLWCFTIVGIFTKRYAYYLVPYILAENPDISSKDAIKLSSKMMEGYKWECFKLEISFIGYLLLGYITLGVTNVFFTNMYMALTMTEFYVMVRDKYVKNKEWKYDYLFDEYLYKKADKKLLEDNYGDVFELIDKDKKMELKGIKGFLIKNFGISLYDEDTKDEYDSLQVREYMISNYKDTIERRVYPDRLYPLLIKKKDKKIVNLNSMRSYSLYSIILMFFIFSMTGWTWEVLLHLINNGTFVNRGVLHGPWLPIYGSGGILILTILYRYRGKPIIEFLLMIFLCGMVEYGTACYLEYRFGLSWWNYNGYFLNINGRVCAEGLLVFGLGGMAGVYFLAPLIDNILKKINIKILYILCFILVVLFIIDKIYTHSYPNVGEGISGSLPERNIGVIK